MQHHLREVLYVANDPACRNREILRLYLLELCEEDAALALSLFFFCHVLFLILSHDTAQLEPGGPGRQPTLPAEAPHSVSAARAAASRLPHTHNGLLVGGHAGSVLHLLLLCTVLGAASLVDTLLPLCLPLHIPAAPAPDPSHRPVQHHQPHDARAHGRSLAASRRGHADHADPRRQLQDLLDQVALPLPDGVRGEGRQAQRRAVQAREAQALPRRAVRPPAAVLLGVAVQLVLPGAAAERGRGALSLPSRGGGLCDRGGEAASQPVPCDGEDARGDASGGDGGALDR